MSAAPERKRSYQLGHRGRDREKLNETPGKMSESRWAWVSVFFGKLVVYASPTEREGQEFDDIFLVQPIPNRAPVRWNLTACTQKELEALRELINSAIDWAMPVVIERDKEAQDAYENGDDSHSRIYRQDPQLVYRKRPE